MCRKQHSPWGLIIAALGIGIIIMCIAPSKLVIVTVAFALIFCGLLLYKKC